MLTPKQLQEIVERMQPILDELNGWIIKDIVKRVMARMQNYKKFEITPSSQWQAQVMIDAGEHLEELQKQMVSYTRQSNEAVRRIFQEAGVEAYEADAETMRKAGVDVPPLKQSPRMQKIIEDTYQRTQGELRNYTRTTANKSQQDLIKALDLAHIKVMSGATSYNEAVRETVMELVDHQASVVYPTGHIDTLEVAVLRAVRTGTAQASGNMTMEMMKQHGWDIVLTSAHLGARYGDGGENPGNHQWWQGRFFSVSGKDDRFPNFVECTGYGTGEGLCGWNCRHSFGPGDGKHNPWKHYDDEENKKAYDLSQDQRKMERDIRKQKRKVMALKEAIDSCENSEMKRTLQDAYNAEYDKLGNMNSRYNSFCDENSLPRMADRLQVAEWNYKEAMKAYETGTAQTAQNNSLTESDNSDKIEPKTWYERNIAGKPEMEAKYQAAIEKAKTESKTKGDFVRPSPPEDISKFSFDDKHINEDRKHGVSREEAERNIREAVVMVRKNDGLYVNYYSFKGGTYLIPKDKTIRTAFPEEQFTPNIEKIMEVMKRELGIEQE